MSSVPARTPARLICGLVMRSPPRFPTGRAYGVSCRARGLVVATAAAAADSPRAASLRGSAAVGPPSAVASSVGVRHGRTGVRFYNTAQVAELLSQTVRRVTEPETARPLATSRGQPGAQTLYAAAGAAAVAAISPRSLASPR